MKDIKCPGTDKFLVHDMTVVMCRNLLVEYSSLWGKTILLKHILFITY